jgi:membrane associated rhomboid family serine protease
MTESTLHSLWTLAPFITLIAGAIGGYLYGCKLERKHWREFMKAVYHIDINENWD